MTDIIVYSKDNCPECTKLKFILDKMNVFYTERNIKDSGFLSEILFLDINTVPVLLVGNVILFGNNLDEFNIRKAINEEEVILKRRAP